MSDDSPRNRRDRASRGTLDYNRISERFEAATSALTERLEANLDGITHRLARMENDIAAGRMGTEGVRSDIVELQRQTADIRQQVEIVLREHGAQVTSEAVHAAAAEASQATERAVEAGARGGARGASDGVTRSSWVWLGGAVVAVLVAAPKVGHWLADAVRFLILIAKGTSGTDPG